MVAHTAQQQRQANGSVQDNHQKGEHGIKPKHGRAVGSQHDCGDQRHFDDNNGERQNQRTQRFAEQFGEMFGMLDHAERAPGDDREQPDKQRRRLDGRFEVGEPNGTEYEKCGHGCPGNQQPCKRKRLEPHGGRFHFGNALSGFKISFGSNCRLMPRISSRPTGSISRATKSRLERPTPCSPESVPPSLSTRSNTWSKHRSAARICWPSLGSISKFTWRLPLPACPKLTIGILWASLKSRNPSISSAMRETGTTTS